MNIQKFDNTHAFVEGWALFNDGEIQRIDEGPIENGVSSGVPSFDSDEEAIAFVREKAKQGSEYHQFALEFVAR